MGVNINYSLPPHASSDMVLQIISRVVGSTLTYEGDGRNSLESSKDNLWLAKPTNNFANFTELSQKEVNIKRGKEKLANFFGKELEDLNLTFYMGFSNLSINIFDKLKANCILCAPSGDHHHNEGRGRALNPSTTLFWASIVTRVAQTFGGLVIYSDAGDYDDIRNCFKVTNSNALYPIPKSSESEIDLKIKFSNVLSSIKPVNEELISFLTTRKNFSRNYKNIDTDCERIETLLKMGIMRFEEDLNREIPSNIVSERRLAKF